MALLTFDMLPAPVVTDVSYNADTNQLTFTLSDGTQRPVNLNANIVKVDKDTARVSDYVVKFSINADKLTAAVSLDTAGGNTLVVPEVIRENGYAQAIQLTATIPANVGVTFDDATKAKTVSLTGASAIFKLKRAVANPGDTPFVGTFNLSLSASTADRLRSANLAVTVGA